MRGRVRARDPFELIRWLALSQPDPRKALAELVQNSLDAGAHHIRVTRAREHGQYCLRIHDDGEGVIPELGRPEALRYIATNIGHSRKRALSPEERLALMTQGQYGIGLLGFWSLGQALEMRTCLPGQKPYRLLLYRDRPDFLIEPLRGRLPLGEQWTEVVVYELHPAAVPVLIGRRAADYLASELRGQLLAREIDLVVEDRLSRGRSPKTVPVRPPRFLGERVPGIGPVEIPEHPPIRFEIYITTAGSDRGEARGLAVYSSGTLVAEGFHDLGALGLDHSPWTDPRLTGMVDFPGFHVAPGSRRGVSIDQASEAFARGLATVEPILSGLLETFDRQRSEELDRSLIRDLQRAFRNFYRQRPRYSLLPVSDEAGRGAGPTDAEGGSPGDASSGAMAKVGPEDLGGEDHQSGGPDHDPAVPSTDLDSIESEKDAPTSPGEPPADSPDAAPPPPSVAEIRPAELFPPGPLAVARILPSPLRIRVGNSRTVRAEGLDASERVIDRPLYYQWSLSGDIGVLREEGSGEVVFAAAAEPAQGVIFVRIREGDQEVEAEAEVEVRDDAHTGRSAEGIPQPVFVSEPGASWRSRMLGSRWEVNAGHHDYRVIADRPTLKLRYLALLFAKEVVLRSHQDPRLERPLEQLVEVAAYADQNLVSKRRASAKDSKAG